jgi:hypothetical protein
LSSEPPVPILTFVVILLRRDPDNFPQEFPSHYTESERTRKNPNHFQRTVLILASAKTKVVKVSFGSGSSRKLGGKTGLSSSRKAKAQDRVVFVKGRAVPKEDGKSLLTGIVMATRKAGIDRSVVFRSGSPRRVYAYAVLPSDPSKIVREAEDGTRIIGRVRNGQFRAVKTQKAG